MNEENLPERLGRYEVQEVIGIGAMGIVYRAFDPLIERAVAIKAVRIPPWMSEEDLEIYRTRFFREAKAAGQLQHPNIVTIYDMGIDETRGVPFIVMEYIRGVTLKERLRKEGPLPWAEAAQIVMEVARGLSYAHARGVVHRDIKPANIMLTDTGGVKIADFGIARLPYSDLTQSGQLLGSPSYMSPEQAMGEAVTPQSDLFSLGIVFYEILTGQKPFQGENFNQVTYKILLQPPPELESQRSDLPPLLCSIVYRLLEKDPGQRYGSADELARDLDICLQAMSTEASGSLEFTISESLFTRSPGISVSSDTGIHQEPTQAAASSDSGLATAPHRWVRLPRRWWWRMAAFGVLSGLVLFGWSLTARRPAPSPTQRAAAPTLPEPPPSRSIWEGLQPEPAGPGAHASAVAPTPVTHAPQSRPRGSCQVVLGLHFEKLIFLQVEARTRGELVYIDVVRAPRKTLLGVSILKEVHTRRSFSLPAGTRRLVLELVSDRFHRTLRRTVDCRPGGTVRVRIQITRKNGSYRLEDHWTHERV